MARRRLERARSLAIDISPVRDSVPYRALWLGQIISLVGTQMRYVAVPYQVFRLTGSNLAVGLIGVAEVVPLIAFSLIGGSIADSMDRRRLIAWTQVGLMVTSGALAVVTLLSRHPSLGWIYGLTAVSAALSAVDRPARSAMVPSLVRPEQLSAAMALRQVVMQVSQIVGPAIGGALIALFARGAATSQTGIGAVYLIDAVTFVGSLVALRWVPQQDPQELFGPQELAERRSIAGQLKAVREGVSFAVSKQVISAVFLIDLSAMIFGMPRAVFPALAIRSFHGGAGVLGLLSAAPAVGALLGALSTGWVPRVRRQGRAVIAAVAVWGLGITFAGLALFSLPLTLLLLAIAGAADVISAVFRGTMLLENTPDVLRGRLTALQIMVVTGGPRLGDVEAGTVASFVGAPASVVIGGIGCLVGTAAVAAGLREFRVYEAAATGSSPT
ncbi:MAG: MFS transporter [Actinomycetota bacterium]|nr:MFS transporter [Actinomycetota bacterium]